MPMWARLAFALNIDSEYICMLDDDTIPGIRWIENCLSTIQKYEGLLGTRGMKFRSKRSYLLAEDVGWKNPNEETERVDIVGHSWFFRREWLHAFWSEAPPPEIGKLVGEDIHFSYALQKFLNLNTFVPPHPMSNLEYWGSQPAEGLEFGSSAVGVSLHPEANERFQVAFRAYVDRGFKLCNESNVLDNALAWGITQVNHPQVREKFNSIPILRRIKTYVRNRLFK